MRSSLVFGLRYAFFFVLTLCIGETSWGQQPSKPVILVLPPTCPPPLLPLPVPRPIVPTQRFYNTDWIIPRHVGGDADFKGHGPIVKLYVRLYINQQSLNEVWAEVRIDAVETKNDWTHATNWTAPAHVRVAVFNQFLTQIITPVDFGPDSSNLDPVTSGRRLFKYTDTTDKGSDVFNNPCECGLLNRVHFIGDQVGREAGTRTGVKLEFNPIMAQ